VYLYLDALFYLSIIVSNKGGFMKKTKLVWSTEQRKIDDLIPYEKNPRTLSEKQEKD